jgi:hypothetical protein
MLTPANMKNTTITAVALLTGSLLLSSCGEAGRYQMVVTPPHEGDTRDWHPTYHVLDTKTGVVWTRYAQEEHMLTWDPANKTLKFDSLQVTLLKEEQQ